MYLGLSTASNTKYLAVKVSDLPSTKFKITGYSDKSIIFTCSDNPLIEGSIIKSLYGQEIGYTNEELPVEVPSGANYIVFNFTDTDEVIPKVEVITETIGGTSNYENLSNKPSINGVTLIGDKSWEDLGLPLEESYINLTDFTNNYVFDITTPPYRVGSGVPSPSSLSNSAFIIIRLSDLPSSKFRITGYSDKVIYFTCDNNPTLDTALIKSLGAQEVGYTNEELNIEIPSGANYIVFNFTNTNEVTPKVENIVQSFETGAVKNLNETIILSPSLPLGTYLDTGFYYSGDYSIYIGTQSDTNLIVGTNEIFYFDNVIQALTTSFINLYFDNLENLWIIAENSYITNEIVNQRNKIPTSKAVYEAIQNISPSADLFYTELNQSITLNADGTISPALTEGYYYLKSPRSITYYDDVTPYTTFVFTDSIFYYDGTDTIARTGVNARLQNQIETKLMYSSGTNSWELYEKDDSEFIQNSTGNPSHLATSIPSTGSDNNVANINAIRNYVAKAYAIFKITNARSYAITQTGSNNGVNLIVDSLAAQLGDNFELTNDGEILVKNNVTLEINGYINPYEYNTGTTINDTIGIVFYYTRNNTRYKIDGASIIANAVLSYIPFYCITELQAGDILQPGMFSGVTRSRVTLGNATFNLKIISYN